ncbi:hypothetical protein ACTU45_32060 [Streptomyces sp. 24-1644]|uniref:hypothetical protein n=1 Tax=Streptomyces sp. 24-1644 TaxID=3457315 RepID=UPI003FA78017
MATPEFRPTHVVHPDGMPAWEAPDVSRPTTPLDPLLPVQLLDRRGDWGFVACANGWSAWIDGRLLVPVPQAPPAAHQPLARTADPGPLLARVDEALHQYRRAAQELADGHLDGEGFRLRTQGLRVGAIVDGEAVWLYDAEHERWVYCDGKQLSTYVASAGPGPGRAATGAGQARDAGPEPTRVVQDTGPEPTRVVQGSGPEPTRVVQDPGPATGPSAGPPTRSAR